VFGQLSLISNILQTCLQYQLIITERRNLSVKVSLDISITNDNRYASKFQVAVLDVKNTSLSPEKYGVQQTYILTYEFYNKSNPIQWV